MARDKKSFVLYADLLKSVDHLTDEELGQLFKHILLYVNDEEPVLEDRLLLTAWKPIERSLKEDLKKWEETRKKRSEAGAKGGKAKQANARIAKQNVANQADSVTVTDTVNVSTKVDVNNFLSWFNKMKAEHTGVEGKFRTLTKTDEKNLKQLRKSYGIDDFTNAVSKLFQNQWANETGNQTPAHFLRVDNFNRYLNQSHTEPTKKKFNPYG